MPSSQPTTRCRNDEPEHPRREIYRHDSSLYFENGNIVLFSLPKNNLVTAFKVHKDFLILHSRVFEGMFSVPLPPTMEKYDHVPRVRLQDDASDIIPFLKALYDPTTVPSKQEFYFSHEEVKSIFKLATKYQAEKLLTCMRNTSSRIWPQNLQSWDDITNGKIEDAGALGKGSIGPTLPEPCFSIRLARDYDLPEILPAAFYHLLCTFPQRFSAVEREDGNSWVLDNSIIGCQANVSYLSREDLACFIQGNYAIRNFIKGCYLGSIANAHLTRVGCSTYSACLEELKVFAKKHKDAICWNGDVLDLLRERCIRSLHMKGICDRCAARYIRFMEEKRRELWGSLEAFFGLEGNRPVVFDGRTKET